jgi:hypothetical protein
LTNSAVAVCYCAWIRAREAVEKEGQGEYFQDKAGSRAYRRAMPSLSGAADIRDFIACTAHGILIEAIDPPEGARLLYAAQVARGALEVQPPRQKSKFE